MRRSDALGRLRIHLLQLLVAALRTMGYGYCSDAVDEFVRISASALMKPLCALRLDVEWMLAETCLWVPSAYNVSRLLQVNVKEDFRVCLEVLTASTDHGKIVLSPGQFNTKGRKRSRPSSSKALRL